VISRTVPERRRKRLMARFRPIVDGLFDQTRAKAEQVEEQFRERDWSAGGSWSRSHPFSLEVEMVESMSGNPLSILGRAIDSVHRREMMSVALVGIDSDGVIHTAWSDGDHEMMSKAAGFLSKDLERASGV
jgi:hypothetical protein